MTMKLTLRPRQKWTEAEFAKMVALLKDEVSVAKVAKQLKRSEAAIRVQATKVRVSASGNLAQRASGIWNSLAELRHGRVIVLLGA